MMKSLKKSQWLVTNRATNITRHETSATHYQQSTPSTNNCFIATTKPHELGIYFDGPTLLQKLINIAALCTMFL
jgi:hypothetical protein